MLQQQIPDPKDVQALLRVLNEYGGFVSKLGYKPTLTFPLGVDAYGNINYIDVQRLDNAAEVCALEADLLVSGSLPKQWTTKNR